MSSNSSSGNNVPVGIPPAAQEYYEPVIYPSGRDTPAVPPEDYIFVFWSAFRAGFRQWLSWLMMELYE